MQQFRPEAPGDADAIDHVTRAAFQTAPHTSHTEQFIVTALRRAGALTVSLVACEQTPAGETTIGHVAISRVTISSGSAGWFGLGPLSVLPEYQRRGIGSELVRRALDELRRQQASGCVVLGEPEYYRRFGFVTAPQLTLPDVPPEYFMAIAFGPAMPRGVVAYHDAFQATS